MFCLVLSESLFWYSKHDCYRSGWNQGKVKFLLNTKSFFLSWTSSCGKTVTPSMILMDIFQPYWTICLARLKDSWPAYPFLFSCKFIINVVCEWNRTFYFYFHFFWHISWTWEVLDHHNIVEWNWTTNSVIFLRCLKELPVHVHCL